MFGWFKKKSAAEAEQVFTQADVIHWLLQVKDWWVPETLREASHESVYLVEVPSLFCGLGWNESFGEQFNGIEELSYPEKRALTKAMEDMRSGEYLVMVNNYTGKMDYVWCKDREAVQHELYATPALF